MSCCLFFFFFFLDPPGDPGKKSIHFRLCTSFRPSAERRLCVNLSVMLSLTYFGVFKTFCFWI